MIIKLVASLVSHQNATRSLESQKYLDQINRWTKEQKMKINEKKTKYMIFNFTKNYQFSTRLKINKQPIEMIEHTRISGTIVQNNLR